MSYNLFLDDERKPRDVTWVELPLVDWNIARDYNQFVEMIQRLGFPKRVSFDHDLAHEHYPIFEPTKTAMVAGRIPYQEYKEKTGYHAAVWLANYCHEKELPLPEIFIHTMNPLGKENIKSVFESFRRHVIQ